MKNLSLLLVLIGMAYSQFGYADDCGGEISVTNQPCGYLLTIGDKVIARCLNKNSEAFRPLVSQCIENQNANIALNKSNSSVSELRKWMNCDGAISMWKSGCGYMFNVNTSDFGNGEHGIYTASCKGEESEAVKSIRSFCKRGPTQNSNRVEKSRAVQ